MSLIVNDDQYKELATFIYDECEALNTCTGDYLRILRAVKNKGIKKGSTADALEEFINQVVSTSSEKGANIRTVGMSAKNYTDSFVAKLDDADGDLY